MNRDDEFIFDDWARLARVDPLAFEQRRSEVIGEFLRRSGAQRQNGAALQREIDAVRHRAATPQDALREISAMLCAQLSFLGEELGALGEDLQLIERLTERARFAGAGMQGNRL